MEEIEERIMNQMNDLMLALKKAKPNDRSEQDRRYAIVITDLEKVMAYYQAFLWKSSLVSKN